MNADKKNKIALENALGKLLGFEEGEAEDLLEHLFTIESEEDLSEYLVQLLGGQSPELTGFAENMSRYRRGEPLKGIIDGNNNDAVVSSSQDDNAALDSFKAMAVGKNVEASKKGNSNNNNKQKQGNNSRVPPWKNKTNRKSPPPPSTASADISSSSTNNKAQNQSTPSSSHPKSQNHQTKKSEQQHQAAVVVEKKYPSRGEAKKICGCFGTKHKALTNCLYCGRISCQVEGYDFCPFCGFMVEAGIDGNNDKAFQQKERLLRFDRDFARRTEVFDDQADYQAPSSWMTDEERQEAEDNQQKHLESLKRPKQTLNLAI